MKIGPLLSVSICAGAIAVTGVPAVFAKAGHAQGVAVAAVFPPWWSQARVRSAVDPVGAIASTGRIATVVTVYGGADLGIELRKAGAWLILNPRLPGCGQLQKGAE